MSCAISHAAALHEGPPRMSMFMADINCENNVMKLGQQGNQDHTVVYTSTAFLKTQGRGYKKKLHLLRNCPSLD